MIHGNELFWQGAIDDPLKNHKEDPSISARSPTSSKSINLDPPTASLQSLPSFSCLSKENMKPSARSNTATNCTPSQISKNTSNLDELTDPTLSKVSKEQKQRIDHSKPSTVEVRSSIDKPSESETIDTKSVGETEDTMNQQILIAENDVPERQIVEEEVPISHIELDGEEPRPSQESGTCDVNSEKTEISSHEEEADDELVDASKLNSSLDSEKESSNPEEQNAGEAADAARARKKWVIAEKTTIATGNSSNKLLKDVVKQFKKLIKLGRKGKKTHNEVSVSMSAASASGGDDDKKGRRHVLKLSSEHLKKSRNNYSVPAHVVGLHEGKIFPRQGLLLLLEILDSDIVII